MRVIASVLFLVLVLHSAAHSQPGPDTPPEPSPSTTSPPAPTPPVPTTPPYPAAQPYPPSPYPAQPYPPSPYPAQPYPPSPYPGQPHPGQPYPPPGVVAPYLYVPLSPEDQELLDRGEISDGRHVGGVLAGLAFGLGIGQAVQGRYGDTGWIFTVGEAGSMIALIAGLVKTVDTCYSSFDEPCEDSASGDVLLVGGLVGFLVFRVWEIVDVIGGPPKHNARVRSLRLRLGMPPATFARIQPYIAPPLSRDGGGTAGVTLRF